MRTIIIAFLCFVSFNAFSLTPKSVINIQHWKTPEGVVVYFVSVPNLPILDVRVVFAAGSAYDAGDPGLAVLTNNMLGEGTTTQDANHIARAFDNIGAQFNVSADRDKAIVSLRTLSKPNYLNPALREFTDVLTKLSFKAAALQRVKNQTIAAINIAGQMPGNVAELAFYKTIYGRQPYAHNPLGTITSIKHITAARINQFYRRYYVTKNAAVVLVGNVTKTQAEQIAENLSKALPNGKRAMRLFDSKALQHDVRHHIPFPAKQTAIMMGQIGISRDNPDYFPLIVGNYVFGGLPLGSILFQNVRNQRGLSYYAGSAFQPLRYRGPFIIRLKTRTGESKKALSIVQDALRAFLKKGPTAQQLNEAKQNLIAGFPLQIANNSDIASVVTTIAFYHRPLHYLDTYERNIRAVTPEQVKLAFHKVINPEQLVVITVGL